MSRYIDAEAMSRHIKMYRDHREKYKDVYKPEVYKTFILVYGEVLEAIINTPTADVVEVVHGEWINLEPEIGLFACSRCEHKILREECNYCPNCGAKMNGSGDKLSPTGKKVE